MTPALRRSGALSAVLHVAVLLALILTLQPPSAPSVEETAVTMEFAIDNAQVQRAQNPAPTPAPAPADLPTPDLPSPEKPQPTPEEPPPPPPPPPPSPPPAPLATPAPSPPIPSPPAAQTAPPAPMTAAPAPSPAPEPPLPVPPVPPPPVPTPAKPVPQVAPPAPKPEPRPPAPRPTPERPNPAQRTTSTTSQPNPTKNTAEDSKTIEATLEKLRSLQRQTQAPTHVYNPPRGGAPGGGDPNGVDNAKLSANVRGAIGDRIRECWTRDAGAKDADKQVVRLIVTTDPTGTIRIADISPNDASRSGGGVARAFAERARRAALDPQCAQLPLPRQMLGENHTFEITFKP